MSNDPIARVHYFPQQFLRTEDFDTEQAYHIDMRRRHNIGHHIWGVVYGLQMQVEEGGIFVQPGMAVDGFGRELILPERQALALSEFEAKDSDQLDVWLLYNLVGAKQGTSAHRCSGNTNAFNRWQELPAIRLEVPDPSYPDPRQPKAVLDAGVESAAHRRPSDDPAHRWPVFLGRIVRDRSDPTAPAYSVDQVGRPAAGVIGDAVVAPSRGALVMVGDTLVRKQSDDGQVVQQQQTGRFSVALRHNNELQEHLRILGPGEMDIFGSTRIHGELMLDGGLNFYTRNTTDINDLPLENTSPSARQSPLQRFAKQSKGDDLCDADPLAEDDAVPQPWRIYRYRSRRASDNNSGEMEPVDQLRIEMGVQAGDASQVVIGSWSPDDEAFMPILTVDNSGDQGAVTVHGDLVVKGDVSRDVAVAKQRLQAEARNFLLGTFSSGVGGANTQLPEFYKSQFGGGELDIDSDAGQQSAVDFLLQDSDRLNRFCEKLLASDSGRRGVMNQLSTASTSLSQFVNLLTEVTFEDRLPAFASALSATTAGRDATLSTMPEGSSNLSAFINLAQSNYPGWINGVLTILQGSSSGQASIAASLLASTSGRAATGNYLRDNPNHIAATLAPVMSDDSAREVLAQLILSQQGGPAALLNAMPVGSSELTVFAGLLSDPSYADRLPEFTQQIITSASGATVVADRLINQPAVLPAVLNHLMEVDSVRIVVVESTMANASALPEVGDNLVANSDRIAPLIAPVIADDAARELLTNAIMTTPEGRQTAGDQLANEPAWLVQTLAPVMALNAPRSALVTQVLNHAQGPQATGRVLADDPDLIDTALAPVYTDEEARRALVASLFDSELVGPDLGEYLLSNPDHWVDVVEPALNAQDDVSLDTLVGQLLADVDNKNGQISVAEFLNSSTQLASSFGTVVNGSNPTSPTYPVLKSAVCGDS